MLEFLKRNHYDSVMEDQKKEIQEFLDNFLETGLPLDMFREIRLFKRIYAFEEKWSRQRGGGDFVHHSRKVKVCMAKAAISLAALEFLKLYIFDLFKKYNESYFTFGELIHNSTINIKIAQFYVRDAVSHISACSKDSSLSSEEIYFVLNALIAVVEGSELGIYEMRKNNINFDCKTYDGITMDTYGNAVTDGCLIDLSILNINLNRKTLANSATRYRINTPDRWSK